MAKRVTLPAAGLATDPNPLLTAAAGGMRQADNVIVVSDGAMMLRPSFGERYSKSSTDYRPRAMTTFTNGEVVAATYDGSTWRIETPSTTIGAGNAVPVDMTVAYPQFAEARSNLYWCTEAGVRKITSTGGTYYSAGMHEPGSGLFSLATIGAVAIPNNTARAWRWCFVKRDANGLVVRSAPSPWQSYDNTTGGTIDMNWIIPLATYSSAGDEVELYATETVATGSTPSDMMYLTKRQIITGTDVVNGYVTVRDARVDADLGAELYTNPTRDGELKANHRPPACGALTHWSDCMWFGRTLGPWTSVIEIVSVTGTTTTDGLTGLQRLSLGAIATTGNATLTGLGSTTSIVVGQVVTEVGAGAVPANTTVLSKTATTVTMSNNATFTGAITARFHDVIVIDGHTFYADNTSTPSVFGGPGVFGVFAGDPERTARELASVISRSFGTQYAYAIEDPAATRTAFGSSATKGTIVIRSVDLNDTQWAVTTTRDGALSFEANGSGGILVDRDDRPHGLMYSKPDEPEHVPEINFITVGSERDPIYALVPLRTSLLVFKSDGVYRITGSPPDGWSVDLLDSSVRILHGSCVDAFDDAAYALTSRGAVVVDEGGVRNLSERRIGRSLLEAQRLISGGAIGFVRGWSQAGCVIFGVPTADDEESQVSSWYVYRPAVGAWTRWTIEATCVVQDPRGQSFFYSRPDVWELRECIRALEPFGQSGFDAIYTLSTWVYDPDDLSVTIADADISTWVPKVGDFLWDDLGAEYRRITAVADGGTDTVCTIASAFTGTPTSGFGFEAILPVMQWQAHSADPILTALYREVQVIMDLTGEELITAPALEFDVGASTDLVAAPTTSTVEVARTATPPLTTLLRANLPREVARATHIFPYLAGGNLFMPWICLGVGLVFEPASERTTR